jgi:glycosyltransferase involved in cell wall biosynthesis
VGRVIPNKKFEDVIRTFTYYKKYFNAESQLILAGDYRGQERYYSALCCLVDSLEVKDVYFTGHRDFPELAAFFKIADVYLSMSEHEGFGVPLLEAFYNRIPVIAFAAGAVEETMNGGGLLLREKDFLKSAAVINKLEKEKSFRDNVIESQLKALEKYRKENVSQILLQHIKRVSSK